jgi:hypothetical protein
VRAFEATAHSDRQLYCRREPRLSPGQNRVIRECSKFIERVTGKPIGDVQHEPARMVERGELDVYYELLCLDNGRLISRYSATDPLPIGQTIVGDDCEEFEVTPCSLWVRYRPSATLAMALLRKSANAGKVRARRGAILRRAPARLGIDSATTRIFSRAFTSH